VQAQTQSLTVSLLPLFKHKKLFACFSIKPIQAAHNLSTDQQLHALTCAQA